MGVEFKDYTIKVKGELDERIFAVLEECAGELESATKRRSRVDKGQTKNSWQHKVTGSFLAGQFCAYIGSDDENAIWEEFGTGEYAITENGGKGGRKTPWYVPVEGYTGRKRPTFNGKVVIVYGKNGRMFYKTNGKKARRSFWNAYNSMKNKIISRIQESLKGM